MKLLFLVSTILICGSVSLTASAQENKPVRTTDKKLYIDVHQLEPGKVKFSDVAGAHEKDLALQTKYGVRFIKYWVNEEDGLVYCLSSASDSGSVRKTHDEAHGLLPTHTLEVTEGSAAALTGKGNLFLDIHKLGAGNVTAAAVEDAHKKDLAVQGRHGVNFINYWVDEKAGVIMCLSEAKNEKSIIGAHKEAHGLIPVEIKKVKQGE